MKVLFDGKLLDAAFLQEIRTQTSAADETKFDAVAHRGSDVEVLETFDSEREAKDFVNTLGEKMMTAEHGDIISMR